MIEKYPCNNTCILLRLRIVKNDAKLLEALPYLTVEYEDAPTALQHHDAYYTHTTLIPPVKQSRSCVTSCLVSNSSITLPLSDR